MPHGGSVVATERLSAPRATQMGPFTLTQNRTRAAMRWRAWLGENSFCFLLSSWLLLLPILLVLLDLDTIAYHPQLKLFETRFPTLLELFHPLSILGSIRHINNDSHQIISIEHSTVSPVSFNFLRFVTGSPEVIHDF